MSAAPLKLGQRTGIGGKNPRQARWRPGCPTDRARQAFKSGWTGNRAALAAHIQCTNDQAKKLLSALQTRREIEGTPGDKHGSIYRLRVSVLTQRRGDAKDGNDSTLNPLRLRASA